MTVKDPEEDNFRKHHVKGQNAGNQRFLLSHNAFYSSKNKISVFDLHQPFPKQALVFTCLQYKSFENTVEKRESAHNEQFLFFLTVFSTLLENFLPLSKKLKLSSASSFILVKSKACRLGKG